MKRILFTLLALVLALFVVTATATAQEATDEPTAAPTVEVTAEPTPVPPVDPAPSADTYISISTLLYGLIIAVLGGGTVGVIINRFGSSKANLDAIEKLFLSFPPETRELINNLTNTLDAALDIIQKSTDGLPNEDTPSTFKRQ